MLASLEAIHGLADEQEGLGSGRIRLGSFPSVISNQLPPLLTTFRQRHPGIEVVALEGTDEEVEAWLASGAIDLGVVLNPTETRAEKQRRPSRRRPLQSSKTGRLRARLFSRTTASKGPATVCPAA